MTLQSSVKVQGFKIRGHAGTTLRGRNPSKSVKADFEYQVPVGLGETGRFVARQKGGRADNRVVLKAAENLVATQPEPYDAPVDGIFIKDDRERAFRCGDAVWFVGYDNQYSTERKDVVQVVNLRTFEPVETHVLNLCWFPDWVDDAGRKLVTRAGHPEQLHNSYDHFFVIQELSDARAATVAVLKEGGDSSWRPVGTDERRQELFMQRLFIQDPTIEIALQRVVFSEHSRVSTARDTGDEVTVKYLPATGFDAASAGAHPDTDEEEEQLVRTLQEDSDPVIEPRLTAPACCTLQGDCPLRSGLGGVPAPLSTQRPLHFHWTDADCRHGRRHSLHCASPSGAETGCICYEHAATHTCCEPSGLAASGGAGAATSTGLAEEEPAAGSPAPALPPGFDIDINQTDGVARDPYTAAWLSQPPAGTHAPGSVSPNQPDPHDGRFLVLSSDFSNPEAVLYTADRHYVVGGQAGGPALASGADLAAVPLAWAFAAGAGGMAGGPAGAARMGGGDTLNELMPDMHLGEVQEFASPAGGDDFSVDPAAFPPPGPSWGT